jgi:hypothetical protein
VTKLLQEIISIVTLDLIPAKVEDAKKEL